jgi:oxygen-independent coproporphyrinogen-3 oxidase
MTEPLETAYVHIPFCKSKCFYCDFNSYAGQENRIRDYFAALLLEIRQVYAYYRDSEKITWRPLKSVYFGGGTPSSVAPEYIVAVMRQLGDTFGFDNDAEITIECNPGTVDLQHFTAYRMAGFNRISIGLQSSSDELLRQIGRIHTMKQFEQCMDDSEQAGFKNRNVDLMFGLPSQTMEDVDSSIRAVLERGVTHLSFYSLILEKGTPFYARYHDLPEQLPSEELEREMYWFGVDRLAENRYLHYEISNLAKPGFSCRQNTAYWKTKEYLGFGAGAHSYQQETRIENESGIDPYISKIRHSAGPSNAPAAVDRIVLSAEEREMEFLLLGFRLLEGVSRVEFESAFPSKWSRYSPRIEKLAAQGYLEEKNKRIQLTKKGVDFANLVFMEFV